MPEAKKIERNFRKKLVTVNPGTENDQSNPNSD